MLDFDQLDVFFNLTYGERCRWTSGVLRMGSLCARPETFLCFRLQSDDKVGTGEFLEFYF